jgi:tetratricopeptide (TPR) repeat protein
MFFINWYAKAKRVAHNMSNGFWIDQVQTTTKAGRTKVVDYGRMPRNDETDDGTDTLDTEMELGTLTGSEKIDFYKRLASLYPEHIDIQVHLGIAYEYNGEVELAITCYMRGVSLGDAIIPDEFKGEIPYFFLENRPYLRALANLARVAVDLSEYRLALRTIKKSLKRNKNDNLGTRYFAAYALHGLSKDHEALKSATANSDEAGNAFLGSYIALNLEDHTTALRLALQGLHKSEGCLRHLINSPVAELPYQTEYDQEVAEETATLLEGEMSRNQYLQVLFLRFLDFIYSTPHVLQYRLDIQKSRHKINHSSDHSERREGFKMEQRARDALLSDLNDTLTQQILYPNGYTLGSKRDWELTEWEEALLFLHTGKDD